MKKVVALMLAVLFAFSLVGCNDSGSLKSDDSASRRGPRAQSAVEETVSEEESEAESEAASEDESLFSSQEETVSSETASSEVSSSEASSSESSSSAASESKSEDLGEFDDALIPLSVQDPKSVKMSDKLEDCTVEIEGKVYKLPMTVNDFMADGWEINYEKNTQLSDPLKAQGYYTEYENVFVNKDGKNVGAKITNFSKRKLNAIYCYITELEYYYSEYHEERAPIKLAKGIEPMKSTVDDVKAAFGEPGYFSSSEYGATMKYSDDDKGYEYRLEFDKDKKLEEVTVRVTVDKPANYKEPAASTAIPSYVTDYKAPKELGNDILSGNVQIDNVIYNLPCPLKTFLDGGWTINYGGKKEEDTKTLGSGSNIEGIYIVKGDYEIQITAYNRTDYEIPIENTIVEEMFLNRSNLKDLDCKLPDGLGVTTTLTDIQKRSDFSKYEGVVFSLYNDTYYNCSKQSEKQIEENKNSYTEKFDREVFYCFVEDTETTRYVQLSFRYWPE